MSEMSASECLRQFIRMCQSFDYCTGCPFNDESCTGGSECHEFILNNPEEAVSFVEAWVEDHPEHKRKTYAEDFFEKFPNAESRYYDGRGKAGMIPIPCRQHCYGVIGKKCNGIGCSCSACWAEEMEGEE